MTRAAPQKSVLSDREDGFGFVYGFAPGDNRQINVRQEPEGWVAYVAGDTVGVFRNLREAEQGALAWMTLNPP